MAKCTVRFERMHGAQKHVVAVLYVRSGKEKYGAASAKVHEPITPSRARKVKAWLMEACDELSRPITRPHVVSLGRRR